VAGGLEVGIAMHDLCKAQVTMGDGRSHRGPVQILNGLI
jgi:hypothetical protein